VKEKIKWLKKRKVLMFTFPVAWAGLAKLFFENGRHFKDIFREFEAFLKVSILIENIFREIEAFFN
jgi:hypothetical protein